MNFSMLITKCHWIMTVRFLRHGRSSNQEYTNDWRIGASRRDFTIISLYLDDFIVADQR